jgi:hypothetical protein
VTESPLVLFPHTHVAGADANRLLEQFGDVTLCQPWYMDSPIMDDGNPNQMTFRVVRPLEMHKPPEDFRRLLSEYRQWMRENRGRGYAAFFGSSQDTEPSDGSLWEVREILRQDGRTRGDNPEAEVLRWHMILHLNREFQEHQREIRQLMRRIKEQTSPLKDALGEETAAAQQFLEDLPESVDHPFGDDTHLKRVCEAWIHLFEDQLKGSFSLVTLNRCVLDFVVDLFQAHDTETQLKEESAVLGKSEFDVPLCDILSLPEALPHGGPGRDFTVQWLLGKRLILWGG